MPTKAVQQFMLGTVLSNENEARQTLAAMKAAGYDGIELCGFMIHPIGFMVRLLTKAAGMPVGKGGNLDWHALVKEAGLQVVSLHTDLGSLERDAKAVADEAKSFGTMVAAGWVKAHPEYHVTLLQLTPLAWEYAPLYAGMPAWHATGTADPLGGAALRRALEDDPAITTYFVEGGNHSLDTPEDYTIGLEALKDIVRKYEEAMR